MLSEEIRIKGIWFELEKADARNFALVLLSFTVDFSTGSSKPRADISQSLLQGLQSFQNSVCTPHPWVRNDFMRSF